MGSLIKGNIMERVAEEVFAVRHFKNVHKNLIQSLNYDREQITTAKSFITLGFKRQLFHYSKFLALLESSVWELILNQR